MKPVRPLILAVVASAFAPVAYGGDVVRQFTPTDGAGNPIGPPVILTLPDQPDMTATGHMVDESGNQASPDFQIPDARQPEVVPDSPDMVPDDSGGANDMSGSSDEGSTDSGGE